MRNTLVLSMMLALASPMPAAAAAPPAHASTAASSLSAYGAATVVEGSLALAAAAGELVAASVRSAGQSTVVVLEGLSQGMRVSATVLLAGAGALSVAAGDVLRLAGTASGHLLLRGGEVIAFVPDRVGAALFHHERLAP